MNLLEALGDLALGACCHGCGTPGTSPCPDCRTRLRPNVQVRVRPEVQQSGRTIPVLSALRYDDHAAGFIVAYKDGGAWQLTGLLGGLLLNCWRVLDPPGRNVIVPLPSHPATVRHRGFDHTLTLARWLAKKTGATASPLLRKVRRDPDQVSLSGSARAAKPQHSMAATSGPTAPLILIDDVLTTGGTAAEAIRALSAAHHRIRAVLVIAERE